MNSYVIRYLLFGLLTFPPSVILAELEWEYKHLNLQSKLGDSKLIGAYRFKNVGNVSIEITSIKTSCDCTTATHDKKIYKPGDSGEIRATFTIGSRIGKQRKTINVFSNENKEPYSLILEADIPALLDIKPKLLVWQVGEKLLPKTVDIIVMVSEATDVKVNTENVDSFDLKFKTIKSGKHYQLILTPKSTKARRKDTVLIQAEYPAGNKISFKVYAYVKK